MFLGFTTSTYFVHMLLFIFPFVISILVCERNTTTASAMEEMKWKLILAAGAGRTTEVKQLLEKGVDINTHKGPVCICSRLFIY